MITTNMTPREMHIDGLVDLCKENDWHYDVLDGTMDVKTKTDYWRIEFKSKKTRPEQWVLLKHLNSSGSLHFHKQGKKNGMYLFSDAITEITRHENYMLRRSGKLS